MTVPSSARAAATSFSFMPPTGSTSPLKLIPPVLAGSPLTGRPLGTDGRAVEPARPQDVVQISGGDADLVCAALGGPHRDAAQRRADLALEVAHPGFARVVANNRVDCVVGDFGLLGGEPVGGDLAGDEIA